MIDTEKYKGHDLSKEGWTGSDYIYDAKGDIIFDIDDVGGNEATLILLNDAPLLLEEVKKLREELLVHRKAWGETEYRLEMAEDVLGRSDWFSVYSELIKEEEE